jgi:PKD repeat protein
MDVINSNNAFLKHPLSGLLVIFLLILLPNSVRSQTAQLLPCLENQSWISRWAVPYINTPGFAGKVNVVDRVGDGSRTTFYQPQTGAPWTFDVNFGLVRNFTGLKIFTPAKINAPAHYEVFVRADSTTAFTSVLTGMITPVAGQDYSIDFGGAYYKAINVRIVFYDTWISASTFSALVPPSIYELNFFQCGVDPLIAKQIPQSAVPTPALSCADEISGTIGGIINTYYPGLSNSSAGSKSVNISLATRIGSTHILVVGDRVLIIQMQNALISETNSMAYGDGIDNDLIASGWLNVQNTGEYEFGVVESISGNTIQLTQPLQKSYSAANVFQVVYSPVYDNVTLNSDVLAYAWDGRCGGIVTFDAKTLNLNGHNIDVSMRGFRGGKMNSNGIQPAVQYFWGTYCTDNQLLFGEKGEGIAGAPKGTYSASLRFYSPEGNNFGGSFGRGAPGNAGGGGNDHNSGGGGGGNVGSGGQGGASWGNTGTSGDMTRYFNDIIPNGFPWNNIDSGFIPNGGMGGTGCGIPDPFRVWLGGGGGGGHQNDNASTGGGNGGGIILVTSQKVVGTGNLLANGEDAKNTIFCTTCNPSTKGNDGAGGGGAGGTIVFGFDDQTAANISYSAKGGVGGSVTAQDSPHGPGGGGGGGAIVLSDVPSNLLNAVVDGGANGIYILNNSPWGANRGQHGSVIVSDKLKALYTYTCDHGDAPFSFGDAAHQLKSNMPSLRIAGDAESIALNQSPNDRNALGDDLTGTDDEDGVYLPFDTLSTAQSYYKVKINVQNPQKVPVIVSGWIDFNENGIFDDKERITINGKIIGDTTLIWKSFPSDITGGDSFARFRISTGNEALVPNGVAPDGEAEDYSIYINAIPHAVPDTICTHQDRAINISVVANDNVQGDKHGKITIKIPPPNGTAVISDNGTPNDKTDDYITYIPKPGYQGIDTLTYELWNAIGNSEAAKVTITVKEPVKVDFNPVPDQGCSPLDVKFTNLSTDKSAAFTWDFGDGSPVSHDFEPAHTFQTVNKTTVFNVKLEINTGCGIFDAIKQITIHALPHAVIAEKSNDDRPEIVVFSDVSTNAVSRSWTVDGLFVGSDIQYTAKFDSVGPHSISLRVFNEFSCSDYTAIVHTTVFRGLFVPNAFIPGGTIQKNKTFMPVGNGVIDYAIFIFDLWGNMIWSSNLLDKNGSPLEGWDGNDKHGKPYPTGAYIWRIKAVLEGNKPWKGMEIPYKSGSYHTQGTITIIR